MGLTVHLKPKLQCIQSSQIVNLLVFNFGIVYIQTNQLVLKIEKIECPNIGIVNVHVQVCEIIF